MDLPRSDTPQSEPCRELCRKVHAKEPVATIFVGCYGTRCNEVYDALVASAGAAMKRVCARSSFWVLGRIAQTADTDRLDYTFFKFFVSIWNNKRRLLGGNEIRGRERWK